MRKTQKQLGLFRLMQARCQSGLSEFEGIEERGVLRFVSFGKLRPTIDRSVELGV
jgi:hypothetical protein